MQFTIDKTIEILERTPKVLATLLQNISVDWTSNNEGGDSWNVFDVIGHLIYGEQTDWIPRANMILSDKADKPFEPFDRFAQFENNKGKLLPQLLEEFTLLRKKNIEYLRSKNISADQLAQTGIHPAFGEVTLSQLLSTWAVHDLTHIAQISRIMAYQYKTAVGPWINYLGILNKKD